MTHPAEIPGRVRLSAGRGGLPRVEVTTPWSVGEVYLHGAQVVHFQRNGETPLLFLSERSQFASTKAIRGGVPVIFPWFGDREGGPAHGTARLADWELTAATAATDGAVTLRFAMPPADGLALELTVTFSETLAMELTARNSTADAARVETCLHTYFQVADAREIIITGLQGAPFFDKTGGGDQVRTAAELRIDREMDSVHFDTETDVEIADPGYQRRIRVRKEGSRSTVVWNPWRDKAQAMSDFGDDEYLQMVCVESGNLGRNALNLPPAGRAVMRVTLETGPLG